MSDKICSVDRCTDKAVTKKLCSKHYARLLRNGSPTRVRKYHQHGLKGTPEHNSWAGMKDRCRNLNNQQYKDYGGRGIKVCDRWLGPEGFMNFLEDMGNKPTKYHSLDRIDVNGDYCPENCRWATRWEQNSNRRRQNKTTGVAGVTKTSERCWIAELIIDGVPIRAYARTLEDAKKWRDILKEKLL